MIWVGVIIETYLVGFVLTFLAMDTRDEANGWAYSYSYGFAMAVLVMFVYINIHGI